MRIFTIGFQHQISFGWSNQEDEMGGACSAYGGVESCMQHFGGKSRRKGITWKT